MTEPRKVRPSAGNRGKGRKKGVPNKQTAAFKDMILQALDKRGGVAYLAKQADENPTAFLTLVGKVLPLSREREHSGEVVGRLVWQPPE
jgi:hypothetical protein